MSCSMCISVCMSMLPYAYGWAAAAAYEAQRTGGSEGGGNEGRGGGGGGPAAVAAARVCAVPSRLCPRYFTTSRTALHTDYRKRV